ncbi:MAG: hypothetical protein ACE5KZ_13890 [Candidatus Scalinduaceae bacterium]
MKYNRIFSVYTMVILSAFLLLNVLSSNETRADKNDDSFGNKITGTYLLIFSFRKKNMCHDVPGKVKSLSEISLTYL